MPSPAREPLHDDATGGTLAVMLRVLAVDDEVPALDDLRHMLHKNPLIEHVSAASDANQALSDLGRRRRSGEPLDAVFLDIRMPGLDGVDFARVLTDRSQPPQIVFVTAVPDRAVEAYEVCAIDYLLKPLREERVAKTVQRLAEVAQRTIQPATPREECSVSDEPDADEMIPIELGGRTRFVPRSEVRYAEAQGDYVRLHAADGSFLVRIPLAELAHRWSEAGFVRIHRSVLVSARYVRELHMDSGKTVVDVDGHRLPVSRRHLSQVRTRLIRSFFAEGESDRPAVGT